MSNKIMSLVEGYWITEFCYTLSAPLVLRGIYDSLGEAKGV